MTLNPTLTKKIWVAIILLGLDGMLTGFWLETPRSAGVQSYFEDTML
jgi:hypothetical protein